MYPEHNQMDPDNPLCSEESAYPANPDSEYGWEKLFSERLYLAYGRCYGMKVRVARYHNIFGPLGTWDGGREHQQLYVEKLLRQLIIQALIFGEMAFKQDHFCMSMSTVEGSLRLMHSDWEGASKYWLRRNGNN